MKYYILFGPPGAGKGTQAKLLSEKYNLTHFSTGALLRAEIEKDTEIGRIAANLINDGHFVPDEIVIELIKHELEEDHNIEGFLLDGFPRTIAQAEALDKMLEVNGFDVTALISIELEEELIFDRIFHRAEKEGRKDDMSKETIQLRIDTYNQKTSPLKDYYQRQNKLVTVDGKGTVEEVFHRLTDKL